MDPLWAVLSHPSKKGGGWDPEEFFESRTAAAASAPVMEMHGVPSAKDISVIESSRGRVLNIEGGFSPGWRHCLYYVTK